MTRSSQILAVLLSLTIVASCGDEPQPKQSEPNNTQPNTKDVTKSNESSKEVTVPDGALSGDVYPTYYTLDLVIDPNLESFTGHAKIDVELKKEANGIWLHGKDLRVISVIVGTEDGTVYPAEYSQESSSGSAWVDFGLLLPAGKLSLIFDYQAEFDNNLSGLFKVEEQGNAYVLAKSESIQARKYLPGFDQPGFKSPYLISMTIPKGMTAISNTREISTTKVDENMVKVQFAETRSTPTYLLSVAVGPFDIIEWGTIAKNSIRDFDIPLRAVARKGRAKDMSFVMGITAKYLELFETAIAQPYPFKKLDIVAAPQWPSGATELSAAITYREQRVLLGDSPAPGAKLAIMNTHAHEIAHMWFGNLVTPPWWDDLWLKEGFATWATPVILAQFEPGAGHELNALRANFNTMNSDSLESTRAIRQPILKDANIRNAYDSITYKKSQAVIHMIDSYFGAEKFRKALGGYIAEFADGVADSPQFYKSISEQTGEPVLTDTFRQFVEQKGVPLMDINIDCQEGQSTTLNIQQSRYKPLGSPISTSPEWNVPMCVKYKVADKTSRECALVSPKVNQLILKSTQCPTWVMPNAEGAGYYRWKLADANLSSLLQHFATLDNGEKIAILDSIFAGFEAGNIEQSQLIKAIEISSQSNLRQVVEFPLAKLNRYIDKVMSPETAKETIKTVTPWYLNKINALEANSNRSDSDQLLLNNLTKFAARTLNHQPIRIKLVALAEEFIETSKTNSTAKLSSDLYNSAFTIAVESLGEDFYQKLVEARKVVDNPLFDNASASAMGAIKDPNMLENVQQYALSNNIGARESFAIIGAMLANKKLGQQHWDWFKSNMSTILNKIPAQWQRRSPRFAGFICNKNRIPELDQLFEKHAEEALGHELALQQTKETILLCDALKSSLK